MLSSGVRAKTWLRTLHLTWERPSGLHPTSEHDKLPKISPLKRAPLHSTLLRPALFCSPALRHILKLSQCGLLLNRGKMSRSRGLQTGLHTSVELCLQGPTSRSSCRADLHPSDAASSTSLYLKARPCGHCGLLQSKGFTSVKCRRGAMSAAETCSISFVRETLIPF